MSSSLLDSINPKALDRLIAAAKRPGAHGEPIVLTGSPQDVLYLVLDAVMRATTAWRSEHGLTPFLLIHGSYEPLSSAARLADLDTRGIDPAHRFFVVTDRDEVLEARSREGFPKNLKPLMEMSIS